MLPSGSLYEAVNGEWERRTPLPPGRHRIGSFADRAVEVEEQLDGIIDGAEEAPGRTAARQLSDLAASISRARRRRLPPCGMTHEELLAQVDAARTPQEVLAACGTLQGFGVGTVLEGKAAPDPDAPASVLPLVGPGRPVIHRRPTAADVDGSAAHALLRDVGRLIGLTAQEADDFAAGAAAGDVALASALPSRDTPEARPRARRWGDLLGQVRAGGALEAWAERAPLCLDPSTRVLAPEPTVLDDVIAAVAGRPVEQWRHWLRLRLDLAYCVLVAPDLARRLAALLAGPGAHRANEELAPRRFAALSLPAAADAAFNSVALRDRAAQRVQAMFDALKSAFGEQLSGAPWIGAESRQRAVSKLEAMTVVTGPTEQPARTPDPPMSPSDLSGNLLRLGRRQALDQLASRRAGKLTATSVNASYLYGHNAVMVPTALLSAPFLEPDWPAADAFGALGALVAHEIFHAFDRTGATSRDDAPFVWTDAELAHIDALTDRVARALDGVPVPGHPEYRTQGRLTAPESMADIVGLRTALAAWQRTEPDAGQEDTRRFFRAWARMWRFKCSEDHLQRTHAVAIHAHPWLRCDLACRQIGRFYDAFDLTGDDEGWWPPEARISLV